MSAYTITTRAEYDYAVGRGLHPLLGGWFRLEHSLRVEIQRELFGEGHTPDENERFYRWCFEHRPQECEECLRPLQYSAVHVSHILSRGAHPEIAHDPRNINILCPRHHATWENGNRESMRIYERNRRTIRELKQEYYNKDISNEQDFFKR